MGFELERVLYETEDFLRRNLRSKSAREAQKRRAKRQMMEVVRRVKRAAFILAGLLVAMVGISLFVEVGFLTWLVALPTIFLVSFLSVFWPGRAPADPTPEAQAARPLDDLAARVEDGLIDRCKDLPGRALPAADRIIAKLNELQPHLGTLDPGSTLAGDARRLIGQHLPRLVDTYLDLPPSARGPASESSVRFIESLQIVGNELDHLLDQCCRDRQLNFETQNRFIESRYREDPRLKGE